METRLIWDVLSKNKVNNLLFNEYIPICYLKLRRLDFESALHFLRFLFGH